MPEITDDQLKDLVKQAFVSLDKEYFDTIGEKLAARMVMRVEGEQSNSAHLKELEQLVSCGCSATIVTILENRLWVSNIGDCQAFLCYQSKEEEEEEMRISMLSIDHYLSNEDESLRLQHLGYDPPEDGGDTGLGEYNYTRCFGNYLVKGGYKETPILATCRDDPVIAEPEIQGPIEITEDLELLVIATKSLCEAAESFSEGPAQSAPGGRALQQSLHRGPEHRGPHREDVHGEGAEQGDQCNQEGGHDPPGQVLQEYPDGAEEDLKPTVPAGQSELEE